MAERARDGAGRRETEKDAGRGNGVVTERGALTAWRILVTATRQAKRYGIRSAAPASRWVTVGPFVLNRMCPIFPPRSVTLIFPSVRSVARSNAALRGLDGEAWKTFVLRSRSRFRSASRGSRDDVKGVTATCGSGAMNFTPSGVVMSASRAVVGDFDDVSQR